MYETEAVDLAKAVQHYEQAADYFKGEESNSSANKCLLKVAQYAAQLEDYDKAISIYEQVSSSPFMSEPRVFRLSLIFEIYSRSPLRLSIVHFWNTVRRNTCSGLPFVICV